jgi:Flp pilus assembly protein TadD
LAGLAERRGDTEEAISLYRSALALRPDNPVVQCQLGLLELGQGHVEVARTLMVPALRADPALRERTRELGRAVLGHGDDLAAQILYEMVLAVAPDDAESHAGAGFALLARHDAAAAIVHLREAVGRNPALVQAQLALAVCADQLGLAAESAGALAHAEAAASANPVVLSRIADIQARRRDFAAATRLYRRVVELAPTDSGAHIALGFLLLQAGDRIGGLAEWRRALELNPNLPDLRKRLRREEGRAPGP